MIAAQYSGADVKVVSEPPEFRLGVTNKEKEFLNKFPLGKASNVVLGSRDTILVHRCQHLRQQKEYVYMRVMLLLIMVCDVN